MFCVRDTATVCVRHFSVLSWRRSFNGPYTRSVLGRFLLFLLFQTKPRTLSTYLRPTGPFSYLMCLLSQSKPSLKPRFSKTEHICRCSCRPSPLRWTWLGSGFRFRVRVRVGSLVRVGLGTYGWYAGPRRAPGSSRAPPRGRHPACRPCCLARVRARARVRVRNRVRATSGMGP